jgi:hypothetical protein
MAFARPCAFRTIDLAHPTYFSFQYIFCFIETNRTKVNCVHHSKCVENTSPSFRRSTSHSNRGSCGIWKTRPYVLFQNEYVPRHCTPAICWLGSGLIPSDYCVIYQRDKVNHVTWPLNEHNGVRLVNEPAEAIWGSRAPLAMLSERVRVDDPDFESLFAAWWNERDVATVVDVA